MDAFPKLCVCLHVAESYVEKGMRQNNFTVILCRKATYLHILRAECTFGFANFLLGEGGETFAEAATKGKDEAFPYYHLKSIFWLICQILPNVLTWQGWSFFLRLLPKAFSLIQNPDVCTSFNLHILC